MRGSFGADEGGLVPDYLKESLLGRESISVLQLEDSAKDGDTIQYEEDVDTAPQRGVPYFHRGPALGTTSRIVQVDRKKWEALKGQSLGRRESCEFSTIDEAGKDIFDVNMIKTKKFDRSLQEVQNNAPSHRSIFGLPMISPFSKKAKAWLIFVSVLDLTFTAFFVPYITAFLSKPEGDDETLLKYVDIITGSIFLFDVFAKFHIGFVIQCDYRTKVEMDGKHVAWYYLQHGGAWIDFVSVMPSILGMLVIVLGSLTKNFPVHLFRYIRMIRIVRLIRALTQSTSMLRATDSKLFQLLGPTAMYLTSVVYCLLVLVNVLGCLLYFVAITEDGDLKDTWIDRYSSSAPEKDQGYHYVLAIYWAVTTVTTVGYGDVTPQTWVELLLMALIMLTQIVIFGFLIGTMTEIVTNSMTSLRQAEKYKDKMESVSEWLMHYDIPDHLVDEVKSFYSSVWMRRQDVDENLILNDLPFALRSSIIFSMIGHLMETEEFFGHLKKSTLFKIASKMTPLMKYPEEDIAREGNHIDSVFFLEDGVVSLVGSKSSAHKYSAPSVFGACTILNYFLDDYQTEFSWRLRAFSCCRVWRISTASLFEIVDSQEGGPYDILRGLQDFLNKRILAYNDIRAASKVLSNELGRVIEEKETIAMTSVLQSDELLKLFAGGGIPEDEDQPSLEADSGSKSEDDGLSLMLHNNLHKNGVHGAVEFMAGLWFLDSDALDVDTLKRLVKKARLEWGPEGQTVSRLDAASIQSGIIDCHSFGLRFLAMVAKTFNQMFEHKKEVDLKAILSTFRPSKHPDVTSGRKSESQVLREALSILCKGDTCKLEDFAIYHKLVRICIHSEKAFHDFLSAVWDHPKK